MLKLKILCTAFLFTYTSCATAGENTFAKMSTADERQAPTLRSITPIFSQLIVAPYPLSFTLISERSFNRQYIREMVPSGESGTQWSQMLTITGAKDLAADPRISPKKFAGSLGAGFQHACPNSFSSALVSENHVDGHEALTVILSCGQSPSTMNSKSETALITVIKGARDYYTIQWAVRGEPSVTPIQIDMRKWAGKYQQLVTVKLCPRVPGEQAPYPSCANRK